MKPMIDPGRHHPGDLQGRPDVRHLEIEDVRHQQVGEAHALAPGGSSGPSRRPQPSPIAAGQSG